MKKNCEMFNLPTLNIPSTQEQLTGYLKQQIKQVNIPSTIA